MLCMSVCVQLMFVYILGYVDGLNSEAAFIIQRGNVSSDKGSMLVIPHCTFKKYMPILL